MRIILRIITCEHDSVVEMLINEVHWSDSVQIPAQHIEQVNLTLFNCARTRVSSARELEMIARDKFSIGIIKEACI